jgi:hypothetical protein
MSWLRAIVAGVLDALFGWGQRQREKPKPLEDAQTPADIKRRWDAYVADRLRDKPDGRD